MQEPHSILDAEERYLCCPICKSSIRLRILSADEELHCGRCSEVVLKGSHATSLQPAMTLAMTGLVLAILANTNPILIFEVAGSSQQNLIITGVLKLGEQGYWPIGYLVFFSAIAAPILYFSSILYVVCSCYLKRRLPWVKQVAAVVELINAWNLVPVFAIACLAAVVKLKMLGNVHWESGMLWTVLLSACSILLSKAFDEHLVNERLGALP
jgi:paraquat-inducible protein A